MRQETIVVAWPNQGFPVVALGVYVCALHKHVIDPYEMPLCQQTQCDHQIHTLPCEGLSQFRLRAEVHLYSSGCSDRHINDNGRWQGQILQLRKMHLYAPLKLPP